MAKDSPFDRADKQLELAHSLCENAAYQFLRMGDCANELRDVGEKFKSLLELATSEVRRFTEEQDKERVVKEQEAPKVESVQVKVTPTDNKLPASSVGAIEVDDGDGTSEESLDLATFRARRMRA
jgi:hypothetical protein